LAAAIDACGIGRLAAAPDFELKVAVGDSLLHGRRTAVPGQEAELFAQDELATPEAEHFFASEDRELLQGIFAERFAVVVANPPYITVKDPGLRGLYRKRFPKSCSGQYSLVCPFLERLFDLAAEGGHIAAIVGNAFMKRQFGKKLVQDVLPRWDLTHVIDTSGAYIPGHGTPTVILLGRARAARTESIRAVMGIRGEPSTPEIAAEGKVWSAIVSQVDLSGSESDWVSAEDLQRETLSVHPWSLQGGGASSLKTQLVKTSLGVLQESISSIGLASFPGLDDAFVSQRGSFVRRRFPSEQILPFVRGESIRDWCNFPTEEGFVPYVDLDNPIELVESAWHKDLWRLRTNLGRVHSFGGKTRAQLGEAWWTWYRWIPSKYR
ncbi:MAG: BREX-2 system adenine-specific DNA-methyltransferase PglX, partial [Acidobacteriota bacterium]